MSDRPSVVFAYTIKGWRLPIEGHPGNHSALLTQEQWEQLAIDLRADSANPWAMFGPDTDEVRLCRAVADELSREPRAPSRVPSIPSDLGRSHTAAASTQRAFGRFLNDLSREAPGVARHVVTVSPDVASSTNLV